MDNAVSILKEWIPEDLYIRMRDNDFSDNFDKEQWRDDIKATTLGISKFIQAKAANRELVPCTNAEVVYHPLTALWKRLCDDTTITVSEVDEVVERVFTKALLSLRVYPTYDVFIQFLADGNIDYYLLDEYTCPKTDCHVMVNISNWNLTLVRFDRYQNEFVPVDNTRMFETLNTLEVDFPTGKVLATDWFRIGSFTKLTEQPDHYSTPSICSEYGRILLPKWRAKNHNFVSIHVGNSSPAILMADDGSITVGYHSDECYLDECESIHEDGNHCSHEIQAATFNQIGSVCTDLWNVTMIDRQVLVDILSEEMLASDADTLVEQYINNNRSVATFDIPPGKYTVYYHGQDTGDGDGILATELAKIGLTPVPINEPYFMMRKSVSVQSEQ